MFSEVMKPMASSCSAKVQTVTPPAGNEGHSSDDDHEWIKQAVQHMKELPPTAPGAEHVKVRETWAFQQAASLPMSRLPGLIVALFDAYASGKEACFVELMWLIAAFYKSLPASLPPADACRILAASRHSCGHGGVQEPLELACRTFKSTAYSTEFFDALAVYRDRISGLHSTEVTRTLGEISMLLWQDPRQPLKPAKCLSATVRTGFFALGDDQRAHWSILLRHLDRSAKRRPDRLWLRDAHAALQNVGKEEFARQISNWLRFPDSTVTLSTGGRHVLKSIIWYAALSGSSLLDEVVPRFIDLEYSNPKAAVHLIHAVGYWLEHRPQSFAEPHRQRLKAKWPTAGTRVKESSVSDNGNLDFRSTLND